jgi:hypothetical protein
VTQTIVLVVGHLIGAYVFARRSPKRLRPVGALVLAFSLAGGVMAISAVSALPD